jgi:hypothetical protein
MLAIDTMGATAQAIFFVVAVVLLVLHGIGLKLGGEGIRLGAIGLAAYVFVFAWNAVAAT